MMLLCIQTSNGTTTFDLNKYAFSNNYYCTPSSTTTILEGYSSFSGWGQPQPVQVDSVNSQLIVTYPASFNSGYRYEATRSNFTVCSFCPYHQPPEVFFPEYFMVGGVRSTYTPMYGPCLDGHASMKIACVQDLIMYPIEFAGEYFYPDQHADALFQASDPYPTHLFIVGTSNVDINNNQKSPTDYGIGKGNVLHNINTLQVKNIATGQVDTNATSMLQAPYLTSQNGNEKWLTWAQHFCNPGCHRNSQYRFVTVRPQDYQGKSPTLAYLSRKSSTATGKDNLTMVQCKLCPSYQAAYYWLNGADKPQDVKGNIIALECYPWFGAVPKIISSSPYPTFNITIVSYQVEDGVKYPNSNSYAETLPCPPNTYNDVCAHSIKYWARSSSTQNKTQCKLCPAGGYHTDGKWGSWFCLPPQGMLMTNRVLLLTVVDSNTNQSLLWSRRDILGFEFECGYLPAHCHQCSAASGTAGWLPDDFNQVMILQPLLASSLCPIGYYCPHPLLQDKIQCPASTLPWSPAGSFTIDNCTCAKGKYLSYSEAGEKQCQTCLSKDICTTGFYMSGWRKCTQFDGATQGGNCSACTNKPPSASSFYIGGAGIEILQVATSTYKGICSFQCAPGYVMSLAQGNGDNNCMQQYECVAVGPILYNSRWVYSTGLTGLADSLLAGTSSCSLQKSLSSALADKHDWPAVSTTCAVASPSNCSSGKACMVIVEAGYDHDFVCATCPPPPANASFTDMALAGYTALASRSSLCSVVCGTLYYLNQSSNTCMLCSDLERAICPTGQRIKGQGCLGDISPFTQNPCVACNISLSQVSTGYYLDYTASQGCTMVQCPSSASLGYSQYWSTPCGGSNRGQISNCVQNCGKNQFLSGSCTIMASGICKNCTTFNPGYYLVANCSQVTMDSQWSLCGIYYGQTLLGFYCPGYGQSLPCPNGKTSAVGAKSAFDCFCPVGTISDGSSDGCKPTQCLDTVFSMDAPGAGQVSSHYMALDQNYQTACFPCNTNPPLLATSKGSGIGISSCTCPSSSSQEYKAVYQNNSGMQSLQCMPCSNFVQQQVSCTSGLMKATECGTVCACVLPPFTTPTPLALGCGVSGCMLGFDSSPDVALSATSGTGSPVYVEQAQPWNVLFFDVGTAAKMITNLIVTSDIDSQQYNTQYAIWTTSEVNTLWTAVLPPFSTGNPYTTQARAWSVVCGGTLTLQKIAVAQWQNTQAETAAVMFSESDGGFWLYTKQISIGVDGYAEWGPEKGCGMGSGRNPLALPFPINATLVAISHAYVNSKSSFLMAYNIPSILNCGVMLVQGRTLQAGASITTNIMSDSATTLLDLTNNMRRQVSAMEVMASPINDGSIWLYMAFDIPGIKLIKWSTSITTTTSFSETEELFFVENSVSMKIVSLFFMWKNDIYSPIIMALCQQQTSTGIISKILMADTIQRTFTEIQNMPLYTHPTFVGGVQTGTGVGQLVAAFGETIFTLKIKRCNVMAITSSSGTTTIVPKYWDGQSCARHFCLRTRSCATDNAGQVWDKTLMRCICLPGYYASTTTPTFACVPCPIGSYCQNQTRYTCPTGSSQYTMTSNILSTSLSDCTCQERYFFTQTSCQMCTQGFWCPDKWNAVQCPGNFDAARSITGAIYPTMCMCSAGYVGAKCSPCPSGMYCAQGTANMLVTNLAAKLTVVSSASEDTICNSIFVVLLQLFNGGSIWYLKQPETLQQRYFCQWLPSSKMVVVMVQVETADGSNSIVDSLNQILFDIANTTLSQNGVFSNVIKVEPNGNQAARYSVVNNTAHACLSGKVPTPDKSTCYCAPGYETQKTQCVGCTAGMFKANAGQGSCVACPIGSTSSVAAASCTSQSSSDSSSSNSKNAGGSSDGGSSNLPLIAGGAVGGVVLVGLLIFGFSKSAVPK